MRVRQGEVVDFVGMDKTMSAQGSCGVVLVFWQVRDLPRCRRLPHLRPHLLCPPGYHHRPAGAWVTLLASLRTWPDRFEHFQKAWLRHAKKNSPSSRSKARQNLGTLEEHENPEEGPTAESEAWALVQHFSGMNTKSFVAKSLKNLQAMGTALTWIIEAKHIYSGVNIRQEIADGRSRRAWFFFCVFWWF
jgi:hypothetical protein